MEYSKTSQNPCIGQISQTGALPCLNSNISTETPSDTSTGEVGEGGKDKNAYAAGFAPLSTQHRKTAFILKESVLQLAETYGIEHLGFLTLTFAEHITCPKQAQKRLNSLLSHVIKKRYLDYVGVFERQKSGRVHYHFLVVLSVDIRTGFNFDELSRGNYRSASPELRGEWTYWRKTAPKYRFGRTELLPVKSNVDAMAKYVGKYIAKHTEARTAEDKGVRLVRYSTGARVGTTRFQFLSPGSAEWRRKVAIFAQVVQHQHPDHRISELGDLSKVLGKRWAYHHRDYILNLP